MRVRGRTAFIWTLAQASRVAVMIYRVKVLDLFAAAYMFGDNICRVDGIDAQIGPRGKAGQSVGAGISKCAEFGL